MLGCLCALLPAAVGAARYTTEPGFDRPGPAYETFVQTSDYQLHELCRDACDAQPRCKSYTFVKPGVEGEKGLCRLKESVPRPVEDNCCISAVKGGKPVQAATPSLKLQWLGQDADKIGKDRSSLAPDGAPDHHMRLEVRPAMARQVITIELREDGPEPALRWSTHAADAELLAVEMQGRRLLPTAGAPLAGAGTASVFDLYAHDIGQWAVDRSVVAELTLADGRKPTHVFTLTAPPDRLLGIWQMHCASTSPGAFEPMTISGRLQLVLLPGGAVTGLFGALPLTGRLDATGRVEGSAEDKGSRVEWQGQLDKRTRGAPVRGNGGFRFVRAADGCVEDGVWSSR